MGQYNFYYGTTHAHTGFSTGQGTPYEACDYARKKGLDFICITDHGVKLKDGENSSWKMTKKALDKINRYYLDFLAIRGFEASTNSYGHMNVINSRNLFNKKVSSLHDFNKWLSMEPDVVVSINHPEKNVMKINDIKEMEKNINLIELGNGCINSNYKRYNKYYYSLLDKGWHLAAVNGQDNHKANWGEADNLTVIIAERLDMESIIEALKARRTYSSETRTLRLTVKGNGQWMGSIVDLNKGESLGLEILAEDDMVPIECIQIITNGGKVIGDIPFGGKNKIQFQGSLNIRDKGSWYVVKVIHNDGRMAISSPIFTQ